MKWKRYRNNVGLLIFIFVFFMELLFLSVILTFFSHFIIVALGIVVLTLGMFIRFLFSYVTSSEIFTIINFNSKEINDILLSIEAYYGKPIYNKNNNHIVKRYYKNGKCFIYNKIKNILIIRDNDKLLSNYDFYTKHTIFLDADFSKRNIKIFKTNRFNLVINIFLIFVFIICYICIFIILQLFHYSDSILISIRDSFIYWIVGIFILSSPILIFLYISYKRNGESIIPKKFHVDDKIIFIKILNNDIIDEISSDDISFIKYYPFRITKIKVVKKDFQGHMPMVNSKINFIYLLLTNQSERELLDSISN